MKDKAAPPGKTNSLVAKKISEIHQVVMPGAWPGTTITATNNPVQNNGKESTPKVLSPLDVSAKAFSTNERRKSGSGSSSSENAKKNSHTNDNVVKSVGIKDNNDCNRNSSLTPSAAAVARNRISARGSITSVGAVLVGATLAASTGSNEVATQLISPEGSIRRKNSRQQQNHPSTKGSLR